MALELFGLGKDITRVRKQIPVFMQVLSTEEGKKDVAEKMIAVVKQHPNSLKKFKPYTYEKNYPHLLNLSDRIIKNLLLPLSNLLVRSQYTVNPFTSYIQEFLFAIENGDDENIALESKNILAKINPSFNIQALILSQLLSNLNLEDEATLEIMPEKWDSFMIAEDPDYDYYFALTLRQTSTERVNDFLEFQLGFWDEKEKFVTFLKAVLVGQKKFIPKQNRIVARQWITENTSKSLNNPQELTIQTVNITSEKVLIKKSSNGASNSDSSEVNLGFSNEAFKQPPFEGGRIKCSLSPQLERRFFSFLWEEKIGTDSAFLDNEEFKLHCFEYGFFVPLQKLPKRFHLSFEGKRNRNVIYHCFYKFFSQNATSGKKAIVATFLLHTFDNFDHISIENLVHHLHDYKLTLKDLNYYLGKTDTKKT